MAANKKNPLFRGDWPAESNDRRACQKYLTEGTNPVLLNPLLISFFHSVNRIFYSFRAFGDKGILQLEPHRSEDCAGSVAPFARRDPDSEPFRDGARTWET